MSTPHALVPLNVAGVRDRSNEHTRLLGVPFQALPQADGYADHPLDGVWARAPYLHNGSVPTLRDLMDAPAERPDTFYRGHDIL